MFEEIISITVGRVLKSASCKNKMSFFQISFHNLKLILILQRENRLKKQKNYKLDFRLKNFRSKDFIEKMHFYVQKMNTTPMIVRLERRRGLDAGLDCNFHRIVIRANRSRARRVAA